MDTREKPLYSLIPLEDFKAVSGVDDRDDRLARFCLVTSSLSVEQYCRRRLRLKKHFETFAFSNDIYFPLREYPVAEVIYVSLLGTGESGIGNGQILEKDFYRLTPDKSDDIDFPFIVELTPLVLRMRGIKAVKVAYWAGYKAGNVPADLAAACLELATWNMNRYRGRRIGMTGNVRGGGRDGEHLEMSMPENVRRLLEPYRRKTI